MVCFSRIFDDINENERTIDGAPWNPNELDALDDLDIGGRALRGNADDDNILKFGDKDQYIAGRDDVLGKGSFGKVYEALDTSTGRKVAVKTELMRYPRPTLPTENQNYEIIGPARKLRDIFPIFFVTISMCVFQFCRWNPTYLLCWDI